MIRTLGATCFSAGLTGGLLSATAFAAPAALPMGLPMGLPGGATDLSRLSLDRVQNAYRGLRAQPSLGRWLNDSRRTLLVQQQNLSHGWTAVKFQDYYQGVEVVGSVAIHQSGPTFEEAVTENLARFDLDVRPSLNTADALKLARSVSDFGADLRAQEAPELKILPNEAGDSARLVYRVTLEGTEKVPGRDVTVDAHTGELLADISHWVTIGGQLQPPRPQNPLPRQNPFPRPGQGQQPPKAGKKAGAAGRVNVFQTNSVCQSVDEDGSPIFLDHTRCDRAVTLSTVAPQANEDARRAFSNAIRTIDYFFDRHGRDSFDGRGTAVNALVNVGRNFSNAFWHSQKQLMGYGDGDGVEFRSFTMGVDVAGHEMTHGVISATAALEYESEYGALNEAIADFFGKMISGESHWEIGKALNVNPNGPGLRNLANPGALQYPSADAQGRRVMKPYPAHMRDKMVVAGACHEGNDNCGVHINSTIIGHAFYRITNGIGRERTEKIVYHALTQLMGPRTNFRTARNAFLQSCRQLYATEQDTTCAKVTEGFTAVGL